MIYDEIVVKRITINIVKIMEDNKNYPILPKEVFELFLNDRYLENKELMKEIVKRSNLLVPIKSNINIFDTNSTLFFSIDINTLLTTIFSDANMTDIIESILKYDFIDCNSSGDLVDKISRCQKLDFSKDPKILIDKYSINRTDNLNELGKTEVKIMYKIIDNLIIPVKVTATIYPTGF